MAELNQLAKVVFQANKAKGFHDEEKEVGTYLMLMVSELGEALEAHRKGDVITGNVTRKKASEVFNLFPPDGTHLQEQSFAWQFVETIKDSHEDEIADTLIRILDYCGRFSIDIDSHVHAKLRYNATRPHKHGGKAY